MNALGASGFEPPTSWSRTRFQHLLQSVEICCLEVCFVLNRLPSTCCLVLFCDVSGCSRSHNFIYTANVAIGPLKAN